MNTNNSTPDFERQDPPSSGEHDLTVPPVPTSDTEATVVEADGATVAESEAQSVEFARCFLPELPSVSRARMDAEDDVLDPGENLIPGDDEGDLPEGRSSPNSAAALTAELGGAAQETETVNAEADAEVEMEAEIAESSPLPSDFPVEAPDENSTAVEGGNGPQSLQDDMLTGADLMSWADNAENGHHGPTPQNGENEDGDQAEPVSSLGDNAPPPAPVVIGAYPLRPVPLVVNFAGIAPELRPRCIWVLWKFELRDGKWTKAPYQPNGRRASVTASATWSRFEEVKTAYKDGGFDGIGMVLTPELGVVAIDIDHQLVDGKWSEAARKIIEQCASYAEVSPSGEGIRILMRGGQPRGGNKRGDIEMYGDKRYVTITGHIFEDAPRTINANQEAINAVHAKYIAPPASAAHNALSNPSQSASEMPTGSILSDDEVLDKARNGKFGQEFSALFDRGDLKAFGGNDSRGDFALCRTLAYFTRKDRAQMDRLFRQSALMRPKWDEKRGDSTYGKNAINVAIARCNRVYEPPKLQFPDLDVDDIPEAKGRGPKLEPLYGPGQLVSLLYPKWKVASLSSEAAHAWRIRHYLGEQLSFAKGLGWMIFDGRRHEKDDKDSHCTHALVTGLSLQVRAESTRFYELAAILSAANRPDDAAAMSSAAKAHAGLAQKVESYRFTTDTLKIAAGLPGLRVDANKFDPIPWVIPFENGVWDQGEWREHQREDYFLNLCPVVIDTARLDELNAAFDANSPLDANNPASAWANTQWGQILHRISGGEPQLERTLQDVAGYCMSGASFQRILLWAYGDKGTGKSTFAELLQTTLGKNAMPVSPDKLSSRSERERLGALLWNRRLGICSEAGNKRVDAELLKALSGGDTMLVRHLFQEAFEAKSRQVLLLVSNDAPYLNAYDDALKDRIMVLPFVHALGEGGFLALTGGSRLEEVRQNVESPLVREFALWALMGARRVKETGEVYRAPVVEKAVGKFWQETDPLSHFWKTIPLAKLLAGINKRTLRSSYQQWCRDEDRQAFQPKSWNLACGSIGLEEKRTSREWLWKLSPAQYKDVIARMRELCTTDDEGLKEAAHLNIYGKPVEDGTFIPFASYQAFEDFLKGKAEWPGATVVDDDEASP